MKQTTCRICGSLLDRVPLLRYFNLPKAAQHFPSAEDIATESGIELTVCQCTGCGLVQLSDPPVSYYRDVIRSAAISEPVLRFKRAQFIQLAEQFDLSGKHVIEIGCGNGEFLALWEGLGVQATGLEHNESAVTSCNAHGLQVVQGYIDADDQILPGGPYQAFTLLMFLEHMPAPNTVLRGIWNNLAEGAIGLVEVPNFDMVVEKRVFAEFVADHLLYFTYESLVFALQRNGFEIIECRTLRDEYVLSAIVRKRCRMNLSAFSQAQDQITQELNDYIDRYPSKSVVIWGAGHQALAMISLAEMGGKINYIVDSAPFKQNRFSPGSHLPILPPETLQTSPPAAIIIMAASYSDEIAAIVLTWFGQCMPFAILRGSHLEICQI